MKTFFFTLIFFLLSSTSFGQYNNYQSISHCVVEVMKELDLTGNRMFDLIQEECERMNKPRKGILHYRGGCVFFGQMSHFSRKPISSQQYAKIVKNWMRSLGVEDVSQYSTHSIRKSKPTLIYNQTKNVDAVRRLLGQSSVTATSAYLGTSDESSLDLARTINI